MAKVRKARADHFHVWRVTAHAPGFALRMCIFLRMRTGCLVLTSDTTSVVDEVKVFFFPSPVRSLLSCNARWPALLVILGSYRQPPGRPQAQQWQVRMIVGIPESPRDPEKRGESHSHCMCRLGPPRGPVTPKARLTRVSTHFPPLAPLRNMGLGHWLRQGSCGAGALAQSSMQGLLSVSREDRFPVITIGGTAFASRRLPPAQSFPKRGSYPCPPLPPSSNCASRAGSGMAS